MKQIINLADTTPVTAVTELAEFEQILDNNAKVVVGFFVSWCVACRTMAPVYMRLAEENPDIKCLVVDVDDSLDLSGSCGITAMPTFKFYDNKNADGQVIGAKRTELVAAMSRFCC
ncbi:hypothetical protein LPJ56_004005 [Coemansia sp. RSA 2599]|nr:hypothetical protein LPJ75_003810 [Coemansia sp. RSA 2598]KAJ1817683.1 hypothetical protein LPJ56_004005 [Coemansia sp. RSA 2599]